MGVGEQVPNRVQCGWGSLNHTYSMLMEASCSSRTTSEEERLWRECLKNFFGRFAARKVVTYS